MDTHPAFEGRQAVSAGVALRQLLQQRLRTHLSLARDSPEMRPVEAPEAGKVIAVPEIEGSITIMSCEQRDMARSQALIFPMLRVFGNPTAVLEAVGLPHGCECGYNGKAREGKQQTHHRRRAVRMHDRIVIDPTIQHGKPVICGTRVPVARLLGGLAEGMTPAGVCQEYDISDDDLRAVLAYAAALIKADQFYPWPHCPVSA